jgi:hypothetical protein
MPKPASPESIVAILAVGSIIRKVKALALVIIELPSP